MSADGNKNSTTARSATRRRLYWFLAVLFFALFIVGVNMPVLDYTKRESLAYLKEPSQKNLEVLQAKQNEEHRTRWMYASPLALLGIVFTIPLLTKYRRKA